MQPQNDTQARFQIRLQFSAKSRLGPGDLQRRMMEEESGRGGGGGVGCQTHPLMGMGFESSKKGNRLSN